MEWTCNEVSPVLVVSLSMIYDVQELTLLLSFTVCSQRIYRNFEFVVCMSLLCREEYRTKEFKKNKSINVCFFKLFINVFPDFFYALQSFFLNINMYLYKPKIFRCPPLSVRVVIHDDCYHHKDNWQPPLMPFLR